MATPLRILYVDDDRDVRRVGTLALRLDPFLTVVEAASADEAIALVDIDPGAFDAFVFDVMMPGTGGLELMGMMAARDDGARAVPIILMTARAQTADIAAYMAGGAKGVIVKPFDPMRLAADLRAIIGAE